MKNYLKFINITRNPSKVKLIARPVYKEGDQFSFFAKSMHDDERIERCAII